MGTFVTVLIDGPCEEGCKKCADVCPVNIFEFRERKVIVVEENEDECTFCNLCLEACPRGVVKIRKEY